MGDAGDREAAIVQLRDALRRQIEIMSYTSRTSFLNILAEQLLLTGRLDEGLAVLDEAAAHSERTGERYFMSDSHRWRGELLRARGDGAAAEASFLEALAIAGRQKALLFELRAATALARLLDDRGDHAGAEDLVAGVYGRLTEGFDTRDARDAAAFVERRVRGAHA